jgi:hypothetical protein
MYSGSGPEDPKLANRRQILFNESSPPLEIPGYFPWWSTGLIGQESPGKSLPGGGSAGKVSFFSFFISWKAKVKDKKAILVAYPKLK